MKRKSHLFASDDAWGIAAIAFFATGHWIAALVCLVILFVVAQGNAEEDEE